MQRLARSIATLTRWGLYLCATGLIVAALYVSVGRQLVPLVADYRLQAEDRLRDALGLPVSIGSLEGSWRGFAPLLVAHDVQVGEGPSALRLDQVRVVPDLLASIQGQQVRVGSIEVDGLQLSAVQDAEGHWAMEGLPQRDNNTPLDPEQLLRSMKRVKQFSLFNSQLTLEPKDSAPLTLTYINLDLLTGASRHRLDGRVTLPDGQPLSVSVAVRVKPKAWREAQADIYLSLPQSDWARWLPAGLTRDWHVKELQAGGEFWLAWADGAVQRAVARVHAPALSAAYAERTPVKLDDLAVMAYLNRTEQGYTLLLNSLAATLGDTRWGEVQVGMTYQQASAERPQSWQVTADRLDLTPLTPTIEALAPLPEKAADVLRGLKPQGTLHNVQVTITPQAGNPDQRLQFAANLQQISFSAYGGAPAAENVTGSITGDLGHGELRMDTDNFALHLDHLFPKPWRYQKANARLTWTLNADAFTLIAPYMKLVGDEGKLAGDFLIRLTLAPDTEDYMDLRVGLQEGDARYVEKYLPTLVPSFSQDLAKWLTTAIHSGAIDEGYFQYQGSLNKGAEDAAHSISLFFKVHDTELAFQPGWPVLKNVSGDVLIEDTGVRVRAPSGQLLNSTVSDVNVDVPHVAKGQPSRLLITGNVDSSMADALKILQEAPIGTASVFNGWGGEGNLKGKLNLDIPLGAGPATRAIVDFTADGATLSMPTPKLELSQVKGAFRYDTATGLSAPDIRAQVFGRPIRGKAVASKTVGKPTSRIETSGQVPLKTLTQWLGVTRPIPASGDLPFQLAVTLDGDNSQLQVDSTLKGLAIDLPAPLGKVASDERPSQWRMSLQGAERSYSFNYANLASLAASAPASGFNDGRAELRLGSGIARVPEAKGLQVNGDVSELDATAWQDVAKRYAGDQAASAKQFFNSANLHINTFHGLGADIDNLDVKMTRIDSGWAINLGSAKVSGNVGLPDADGAPINVQLKHLRFPPAKPPQPADANAQEVEEPDSLADVDPRQIPALNLNIARVYQGDALLGAWSLKARPNAKGVVFSGVNMGLKGLQLEGSVGWEGAPGATSSWFKGRIGGKNLADVLLAWNFAPTATSEDFHMDIDGQWPGSPAWISLKRFSGTLDPTLRKGQFVEAQGSTAALRVFGLLNFNSIGRRLRLDFSDLLDKGLSYDRVKGLLVATNGVYVTKEPITLAGPSSNLEMNGTLDMASNQVDAKLLVTLPLTNNLPLAALIVGAPAIGGALFVADKLLGKQVARFASVQYSVKGSWQDPKITFDKPFEKPR
ncbi:YhdP family protein [Pseudomonas turukhanskensis]|uniref:TIGR02099 family protein n=1 Tax=Pseudomonas turukhanskensis TaxID=1806536 RepID=A0A9W6NG11_9PSED|nr:YhdP family protein [Pseudomonas turukhanskensis]GLK89231.1 TIGR02099 family protein [Pseudomonas turukhanskensis]